MSGEINFDEFQREISEAERYLSSDPGTVVGEIRSSMTFEPMRRSTGSDDIRKFKVPFVATSTTIDNRNDRTPTHCFISLFVYLLISLFLR